MSVRPGRARLSANLTQVGGNASCEHSFGGLGRDPVARQLALAPMAAMRLLAPLIHQLLLVDSILLLETEFLSVALRVRSARIMRCPTTWSVMTNITAVTSTIFGIVYILDRLRD